MKAQTFWVKSYRPNGLWDVLIKPHLTAKAGQEIKRNEGLAVGNINICKYKGKMREIWMEYKRNVREYKLNPEKWHN